MLDKLALTSSVVVTFETACRQLKGHYVNYSETGTRYHKKVVSFNTDLGTSRNHLLTLHLDPRFSGVSPTKIEVNPSRFVSFDQLQELLVRLVPLELLAVKRIDHAVDVIGITVSQVYESLIYPRKKFREVYNDGVTLSGFYLGKPPEHLCIYDKAKLEGSTETKTRIELRHSQDKVPEKQFLNLPKLQSFQPFARLEFKQVKQDEAGGFELQKREYLKSTFVHSGAMGTYKLNNRHSNFRRDFANSLEPNPNIPSLDDLYQDNLSSFFKGGTHVEH